MATVDVDILQVDTSKTNQSFRELQQECKDLRDKLAGLNAGTKEYNDTLVELGDKTHQLKEINEQVKQTTTDFGDRLSNVRGTITGMSGAFQTVIGSLSLMGVNLGDDVKMLKMLQSAMSITQGVAAIDSGVKAFKALTISIKASTAAMSGLKKALISTGIGALVVVIGTLVSYLSSEKEAHEEAAEAAKKQADEIKRLNDLTANLADNAENFKNKLAFDADGQTQKAIADITEEVRNLAGEIQRSEPRLKYQAWAVAFERMYNDAVKSGDKTKQQLIELAELQWQVSRVTIKGYNNSAEAIEEHDRRVNKLYAAYAKQQQERINAQKAAAQKAAEVKKSELQQIAAIEREAQIGLMSSEDAELAKLEDTYKKQIALYKKRGQDTATLTEYYEKQRTAIVERYAKERAEKEKEKKENTQQQAELQAETEYRQQQAAIIIENAKNVDEQLLQLDIEFNCQQQELLRQRLEQNLITQQDFDSQLAALEVEAAQLQIEQEQKVTEKTKAELEKRKKIHENYAKATGSVVDSVCNILGSIGSTLEQGTAEWKAVMTAQAIISTIKGGIDSYMGMIASIPGPAGIVAGVAAAVATVAAGMAEVAKIQSTEVSTTGGTSSSTNTNTSLGNVNAGAVSMLSTQVTNTRNIATEDDIAELPETRVYVLESDITDSQNRVRTTVRNSTF